jgi:hypothetical protein
MIITPLLVVFMVIVFILLFLFFNTIDRRKWLTFLVSLVLTPIVYFYVFYPFLNIISSFHHQKHFDARAWSEEPALRYEMVDDMMASDTLIGLSKSDIEKRLGRFEWLTWDETLKKHDSARWNYGLGIEPGAFNNKKESLEIIFKNDSVVQLAPYQQKISYDTSEE